MSDDLTLVLREDGQDRFAYTRWGASQLYRDLLVGPADFEKFVRSLPALDQPLLMRWLQGLVVVDLDARRLSFWAAQFGSSAFVGRKLVDALLAQSWPGWTLHWLHDPWGFARARFDADPSGVHTLAAITIDEFVEEQNRTWEDSRNEPGVLEWVADVGADEVRSTLEVETHRSLCVIGERTALIAENWVPNTLARVGPRAVEVITTREGLPLEDLRFRDLQAVYLIDPDQQRIRWWLSAPRWNEHPNRAFATHWPGWTHGPLDAGPDVAFRAFGLPFCPPGPNHSQQLRSLCDRLLGARPSGADALARVAAQIDKAPGERVVITPPGPGDSGPGAAQNLERRIAQILTSPEFEPQ